MRKWIFLAPSLAMSFGCGDIDQKSNSQLDEAWDRRNDPVHMGYDYITQTYQYSNRLANLPTSGQLQKRPWSGDYWATSAGGVARRWAWNVSLVEQYGFQIFNYYRVPSQMMPVLSPIEKFDMVLGNTQFELTQHERRRTNILRTVPGSPYYDPNYSIPSWEGLCHAWAPATLHFENPGPTTWSTPDGRQIPFGSSDIKALLTYMVHYSQTQTHFLGGRCELDFSRLRAQLNRGEISLANYLRQLASADCRDANAGAFHIVLTNQIGLMREGFVIDKTRDYQVWNQPVFAYNAQVVRDYAGRSATAAPGTVREVEFQTAVYYINEVGPTWNATMPEEAVDRIDYRYRVELDSNGLIIGGEWLDNGTTDDRPDFLWKQSRPEFTGRFAVLGDIYRKSIGNPGPQPEPEPEPTPDPQPEPEGLFDNLIWRTRGEGDNRVLYIWGPIGSDRVAGAEAVVWTESGVVDRRQVRVSNGNLSVALAAPGFARWAKLILFDREGRRIDDVTMELPYR